MTDFAPLEIKVSESGTTVATSRLDGLAGAADRAGVQTGKLSSGVVKSGKSAKAYGGQMKVAAGQTANLTAQLNDIGVMLAAGQNPLQLAMQQGTQINQVFAQMGGGVGAVKALGGAFVSMLNPLSLATIGIIAGGAALVQWGMSAWGAEKEAYKLSDALGDIKEETKDATSELAMLERGLDSLAALRLSEEIDVLNQKMREYSAIADEASGHRGRAAAVNARSARDEIESLQSEIEALNDANDALKARKDILVEIESIGKAGEMVAQYERQAELSNAITQYGQDSADVEAVKRSHAASSVEEYIRQNNLSGQVAQSLRDSAMAAYDADVNAAAAANSLSQAEAAARGMAAALAQAAGFSANLDATVATLEKEISLLKSGADQALASQVAALEVKAESAAADVLLATGSKELSEIAALGYEAQIGKIKELSEAKANEIKITKAQGKAASASGKKIKKAMSEAEKAAEKYADTMNGYVVDAIVNVSDSFFDFLGRGFKDFKSFAGSILDGFKNMLLNMIKMAAQNKIMISMGLGGSVLGGAASAATGGGGILGSVAGSIGGVLGVGGAGLAGLAGSGGIMGGIGSIASGLGGVLSGGGLGASFANLGGLLSGSIGGLGALGAAIPAIGIIAAGLSAIIGKTKKVDEGLRITVRSITDSVGEVDDVEPSTASRSLFSKILGGLHGGTEKIFTEFGDGLEVSVDAYVKTQTSRLLGLVKTNKTKYQGASEEITNSISSGLESIQTSIIAYAGYLGVGLDTFDDFYAQLNVSLKGLSEDEKLAAIEEALTEIGDEFAGMIEGLSEFSQEGEGATATLERLVNSVSNVNQWWDRLGFGLEELSLSGGAAASAIVDLYGDLDTFTSLTGAYYNNFYSQQERTAQAIQEVTDALADIGVDGLPASRDAFRELVEAAEAAGDDQLVADLIAISGAFAEITAESNALASSLDASMFATRAAFEFAQAQIASGGSSVDYESADTALLRELVTYVREGNIVLAQNTADTARELMRQNLNAEGE